ncbi:hypothetical protein MMC11_005513 [Xylographa trunciseda]|nr:hypothetical protein [Xylographa trunciseda]
MTYSGPRAAELAGPFDVVGRVHFGGVVSEFKESFDDVQNKRVQGGKIGSNQIDTWLDEGPDHEDGGRPDALDEAVGVEGNGVMEDLGDEAVERGSGG